ncbi:MAG: carboxymuconolactone decarboxylase [Hyphomicrobiales bacterium]|nr:carboxymuconolactone decarboxylase [Hyphomicrobiales bacterium]
MSMLEKPLLAACAAAALLVLAGPAPASAQTAAPAAAASAWPADVDAKSGFRLPLPRREDLNESARKTYDRGTIPGANIAGLQGPAGIQLYSPLVGALIGDINRYLRQEAGLGPRVREIALIITSREMDNQFEWTAHEPEAVKAGVPQNVIDTIKFRRSTEGLDATDAIVIQLGREIWHDHKVKPETFAKAKAIFGPNKLVDLVLLMGSHASTAALLTAFDMQLHEGTKPLLPIP